MPKDITDYSVAARGVPFIFMNNPSILSANLELTTWEHSVSAVLPDDTDSGAPDSLMLFIPERTPAATLENNFKLVYVNCRVMRLKNMTLHEEMPYLDDDLLSVPASIWSVPGVAPENEEKNILQKGFIKNLLRHRGHPCLVEYYAHTFVGNEHRFLGPAYNAWSLQEWLSKVEGISQREWLMPFAKSIFIQLMFSLHELHRTDRYFGEEISPSDIRMTSEGSVLLHDRAGEKKVSGHYTTSSTEKERVRLDILSAIKIFFVIVSKKEGQDAPNLTVQYLLSVFSEEDLFRDFFITVLFEQPEWTSIEILNCLSENGLFEPCQISAHHSDWKSNYQKWSELEGDASPLERQNYLSSVKDAILPSINFLKNNYPIFLRMQESPASMHFNPITLERVSDRVRIVLIPSEEGKALSCPNHSALYCIKTLDMRHDFVEKNILLNHALPHLNVASIRSFKISPQEISVLTPYADKRSLQSVIKKIPLESMNDFLFGVTTQILMGLAYLEQRIKPSYFNLSSENILLDTSGIVTTMGLITSHDTKFNWSACMPCLSKILMEMIPQGLADSPFQEYASSLKSIDNPYDALCSPVMNAFINVRIDSNWTFIKKLNQLGLKGDTLKELISSWEQTVLKLKKSQDIIQINAHMNEVFNTMEKNAINSVSDILKRLVEINETPQVSAVLLDPNNPIKVGEQFSWIPDNSLTLIDKKGVLYSTNGIRCTLHQTAHEGVLNNNGAAAGLFAGDVFRSVVIDVQSLNLGSQSGRASKLEASIWVKSVSTLEIDPNKLNHVKALLRKREHPCLIDYYAYTCINGQHRYLGQGFNALSLKYWKMRLQNSISPDIASSFSKSIFVQLMFALYDLHRDGQYYGEPINPEAIRIDLEGNTLLPNAYGERLLSGIPEIKIQHSERYDILSAINIAFYTLSDKPWDDIKKVTVEQIIEVTSGDLLYRSLLLMILDNPDLTILNILKILSQYDYIENSQEFGFNWEHISAPSLDRIKYLVSVKSALTKSRSYIENQIAPLLLYVKPVLTSDNEWVVLQSLSDKVFRVRNKDLIMQRFSIPKHNRVACIKKSTIVPGEEHCLRRAVSILEQTKGQHPNIIKLLSATRMGNRVNIMTEYASEGTLGEIVKRIEPKNIEPFLFAITVQILQGLLFLHEYLGVAFLVSYVDHLVIQEDGCVKFIGFNANGSKTLAGDSDMARLSKELLSIITKNNFNSSAPRMIAFAKQLQSMTAFEGLQNANSASASHLFTAFQASWPELIELNKQNISGANIKLLFNSMRSRKDAQSDKSLIYRFQLDTLIRKMSEKSISHVQNAIAQMKVKALTQTGSDVETRATLERSRADIRLTRCDEIHNPSSPFLWMDESCVTIRSSRSFICFMSSVNPAGTSQQNSHEQLSASMILGNGSFDPVTLVGESGRLTKADIWYRAGMRTDKTLSGRLFHSLLREKQDRKHIVRYDAYLAVGSEHRFISEGFNCSSLAMWMKKFVFTQKTAIHFAKSVFIQLIFALYELAHEGSYYGEPISASNVRINNEGMITIPDARAERIISGTNVAIDKNMQRYDIMSVIKLVYSIVSQDKYPTPTELTLTDMKNNDCFVKSDPFFILMTDIVSSPSMTINLIIDHYLMIQRSPGSTAETADKLIRSSQEFIANYVPLLTAQKTVYVTSGQDWIVKNRIADNAFLMDVSSLNRNFLRMPMTEQAKSKWIFLKVTPAHQAPITSLSSAHLTIHNSSHPNMMRIYQVVHEGGRLNVLMEYASRKNISDILVHFTDENQKIKFLFAVAAQILSGLLFIKTMLGEEYGDFAADKIVFSTEGYVKLIKYGAHSVSNAPAKSDMKSLSDFLLLLAPNARTSAVPFSQFAASAIAFTNFAQGISQLDPYTALCLPEMQGYFNPIFPTDYPVFTQALNQLKKHKIEGGSLNELMLSWKKLDEVNRNSNEIDYFISQIVVVMQKGSIDAINQLYLTDILDGIERGLQRQGMPLFFTQRPPHFLHGRSALGYSDSNSEQCSPG